MTNSNRNQQTEMILDLTLEVNYLLTGEDYVVVRSGLSRSRSSRSRRTQSPGTEPPPHSLTQEGHNEEKILELTHTIIHLLTGEVLAYIQGYKDMVTKTLQPPNSLDGSTIGPDADGFHTQVSPPNPEGNGVIANKPREGASQSVSLKKPLCVEKNIPAVEPESASARFTEGSASCREDTKVYTSTACVQERPPSTFIKVDYSSCREGRLTDTENLFAESSSGEEGNLRSNIHRPVGQAWAPCRDMKDPAPCEEGNLVEGKGSTITEQMQHPSTPIKEESASCVGGDFAKTYIDPPAEHMLTDYQSRCIIEKPASRDGGDLPDTDIRPLTAERTQTGYPSTHIKEESAFCDNSDHTQTGYPNTHINQYPVSHGEGALTHQDFRLPRLNDLIAPEVSSVISDRLGFKSHPITPRLHRTPQEKSRSSSQRSHFFQLDSAHILHQRVHGREKPYRDYEHGKLSGPESDPPAKKKAYSYSECGKCFGRAAHICKHQTIHARVQSFPCSDCGKRFSCRSYLNAHRRIHAGRSQAFYPERGKPFGELSSLHKPQVTRATRRSYPCPECGKSFTSKSNLNTHRRIHAGVKLFSCSECGKCFTDGANLAHHQLTHTGEKPFSCSACGKRFSRKYSLTRHQRVHRERKPFPLP